MSDLDGAQRQGIHPKVSNKLPIKVSNRLLGLKLMDPIMASVSELLCLQRALNGALDSLRDEMKRQSLPELSSKAQRHPMDDPTYLCSPRLYEARRLALGT